MADDKKNIPEAAPPTEAPAPAVENAAVLEQSSPGPALTDAEAVMLEHEGQAALFEMGEAVPDLADAVTHAEVEEPAAPEVPKAGKEQAQPPTPGKDDPAPAHSGKVVDFSAARDEAAKEEKKAVKQKPPTEKNKAAKPGRGRPPKDGKVVPDKAKSPKPRDKKSQGHFSRSVFFSDLPSSGGCLAFQSSSREMILSFISLGDLSLPKYFSSSALLMITLSTSFFSCDRIPSITSPLSLPSLSSSRIFCACDSEGEDCCPSMDTAIYL